MSKKYKLTTTVPGNVSINLPDGQILKTGKVVIVGEDVVANPGVAKYIEIGRIVVLAEGVPAAKAEETVIETAKVTSADGDTSVQKVVKAKPARKAKVEEAAPVVETAPSETPAEAPVDLASLAGDGPEPEAPAAE